MYEELIIPDWLRRTRDGEAAAKGHWDSHAITPTPAAAAPTPPSAWERIDEQRKAKRRGAVEKMLAIKADRAAAAAGKTWDVIMGKWT